MHLRAGAKVAAARAPSAGNVAAAPGADAGWHVFCSTAQMENRGSCDRLRHEHGVMQQVLGGLDVLAQRQRGGLAVPPQPVSGAIEFFSAFVGRCHDPMEEEGLFPMLTALGMPGADILAALRAEHAHGRRLLAALPPVGDRHPVERRTFELLSAYAAFLRRHLEVEEAQILPFAERVMSPDDDRELSRTFDHIEERTVGRGGRQILLALGVAVTQACRTSITGPGTGSATLVARDVMRTMPRWLAPADSLARAAALMESVGSRELPVAARGALVGILSRTDMEPHRGHWEWTAVGAAMTTEPVSVPPGTPVRAIAMLLLDRGFNGVPVTSGGVLLGMITRSDLLRSLAAQG